MARLEAFDNIIERASFTVKYFFAGVRAQRSLPDLLRIMDDWHPDLVVRETTEYASCVAAERAGIPHAVVQVTAARVGIVELVQEQVEQLCTMAGLPQMDISQLLFHYLFLLPRPLSLWNPACPLPHTTLAFKYSGFNLSGGEGLPGWVSELEGRPTVYVTLGTVFNKRLEVFRSILDALEGEPINLIVTVGRDRDPAELGPQPSNVHIERYVPQSLLLPYCDAVISHGGSGTMMDTLSRGLPMVMMPLGADQEENALCCTETGVTEVVTADNHTPEAIRGAVRAVLTDPRYRQNVQKVLSEIDALPGIDHVVTVLERLAAERAPLVAPALLPLA